MLVKPEPQDASRRRDGSPGGLPERFDFVSELLRRIDGCLQEEVRLHLMRVEEALAGGAAGNRRILHLRLDAFDHVFQTSLYTGQIERISVPEIVIDQPLADAGCTDGVD